jgi:integrase
MARRRHVFFPQGPSPGGLRLMRRTVRDVVKTGLSKLRGALGSAEFLLDDPRSQAGLKLRRRKDTGTFYCQYLGGRRISLKTKDPDVAELRFHEKVQAEAQSKHAERSQLRHITLTRFAAEYEAHRTRQPLHRDTLNTDTLAFRKFTEALGNVPLRKVGRKQVEAFKASMITEGARPAYTNALLRSLSSAFTYAAQRGYIRVNPFFKDPAGSVLFDVPESRKRASWPEVEALLAIIEPQDEDLRLAVLLAAFANLKLSTIARLRREDIDLASGFIKKGDQAVPLHPELREALERFDVLARGAVFRRRTHPGSLSRVLRAYARRAGVRVTFEDLRGAAASVTGASGHSLAFAPPTTRERSRCER